MNDEKKELKVAALENGTVIDEITSPQLFKVVSILGLENCTNSITIGNNLASKKIGKKGIIDIVDYKNKVIYDFKFGYPNKTPETNAMVQEKYE